MSAGSGRAASHARVALLATAALGCRGERWLVGSSRLDAGDAGGEAGAVAPTCPPPGRAGDWTPSEAPDPRHVGRFEAVVRGAESARFPSSRVSLTVNERGDGALRFEDVEAPVLPSEPTRQGYACELPLGSACGSASRFVGGVPYALREVSSRGSILSFALSLDEPWDAWCRAQTPTPLPRVDGCEPELGVEAAYEEANLEAPCSVSREGEWVEMDCGRLATIARRPCDCSESGCTEAAWNRLSANLQWAAPGTLEGALWFDGNHALSLRFERRD